MATNPTPQKAPVGGVRGSRYIPYVLNPDVEGGKMVVDKLRKAGFNAHENPRFDWIHDTFLIIIRMFPRCLPIPTVIVSMNARYDPHYHCKVGSVLRPLRYDDTLIIGTGGTVHNLYQNYWNDMLRFGDNFAQAVPPGDWALEFRQAVEDVFTKNTGPALRRAMTRLMKHPRYREAHGTDDHFMSAIFAAGAAGGWDDVGPNTMTGECWELVNMCNTQFKLGAWE